MPSLPLPLMPPPLPLWFLTPTPDCPARSLAVPHILPGADRDGHGEAYDLLLHRLPARG